MTAATGAAQQKIRMAEKLAFIQMRRKGLSAEEILQERLEKEYQSVLDRASSAAKTSFEQVEKAYTLLATLTKTVGDHNVSQAATAQASSLAETVSELAKMQKKIEQAIAKGN